MFWAIEINLVFWLFASIFSQPDVIERYGRNIIYAGFVYAAIIQHWAYYKVHKEFKKK